MSNTWITDLRHYLAPTGAMATDLPSPARRLAEYFASIVVDATTNIDNPPSVRCRRRQSGDRRCSGIIFAVPYIAEDDEGNDPIHWHCPVCHDNGVITGWQNTLWDGFTDPEATS